MFCKLPVFIAGLCRASLVFSLASLEPAFAVGLSTTLEPHVIVEELPEWLRELNLNSIQIRQVIVIDELFHQRLTNILTAGQYAKLQEFSSNDGTIRESIRDTDLGLSPYQQALLNEAYQEAMTSLLNILSQEQQRLFFYNLEN